MRGFFGLHSAFAGFLTIIALVLFGREGADHIWLRFGGHLLTFGMTAIAGVAVVLAGNRPSGDAPLLCATAAAIFVNAMILTYATLVVDGFPRTGTLNWTGKSLATGYSMLAVWQLLRASPEIAGLFALPRAGLRRISLIALGMYALLGLALAFADSGSGDPREAALFQLTMPSISEELLFRVIILTLFAGAVVGGSAARLPERFGRAALASSLMFGLIHGLLFSPSTGLLFQPLPIAATALIGASFAWLTIRSGSIWPAVIAHSIINATGPILRLAGVL